jgi:hypothetical protein
MSLHDSSATQRRGFSVVIAMAILGLVGVALLLLTREVGYEFQRTRIADRDAQLRQLLLAGAQDVVSRAVEWGPDWKAEKWSMSVPRALANQDASLSFESSRTADDIRRVTVIARLQDREKVQSLLFVQRHNMWELSTVSLDQ